MSVLEPSDAKQIAEMISWVVAEGDTLEIVAGGTKRALGRPMKTDHVLDVSRLAGIVEYEAAELVLTARPGDVARLDQRRACEEAPDAGFRAARLARPSRR